MVCLRYRKKIGLYLIFKQKCDIMIEMNNDKNNLAFRVPSFERAKAYNFDSTIESFAVYKELSEIAEEIEKCRLKNI